MGLELIRILAQIEAMGASLREGLVVKKDRMARALEEFRRQSPNLGPLRQRIRDSQGKTTWLVAGLVEGWDASYPAPSLPPEHVILASDGSQMEVDRHALHPCYVINIGSVALHYGEKPGAFLSSEPALFYRDEDMFLPHPQGHRWEPLEGPLLQARRAVMECAALLKLTDHLLPRVPGLALLDGSLILWGLAGKAWDGYVREQILGKELLPVLDAWRERNRETPAPLASYISYPRSTDVVNALRVAICPYEPTNCDRYCPTAHPRQGRACDVVAGVLDRDLFGRLLGEGERSALFRSLSSIVQESYGEHEVHFFYLNGGEEIARVEVPRWVALDRRLLDLAHSLILDQVRRGQGYPVALSEAHEKAVLSGGDREMFWRMVEAMHPDNLYAGTVSAKSRSKRLRGV